MTLLQVKELDVRYKTLKGELKAVQGVSFDLEEQQTMGIVGESGCGKSTLGLALLNLMPPQGKVTHGKILLDGEDILSLDKEDLRRVRGKMVSMIFQDPMTSLNPVKKIGDHLSRRCGPTTRTSPRKKPWGRRRRYWVSSGCPRTDSPTIPISSVEA